MSSAPPLELSRLARLSAEVAAAADHAGLAAMLYAKGSTAEFSRELGGPDSHTAGCFSAFFAACARLGASQAPEVLTDALLRDVTLRLSTELPKSYAGAKTSKGPAGPLPNQYNTPIHVAGLMAAARATSLLDPSVVDFVAKQISWMRSKWPTAENGIPRLEHATGATATPSASTASAYFTYWVAEACAQFSETVRTDSALEKTHAADLLAADRYLASLAKWAARSVAAHIAAHHSGQSSAFDPFESLFATAILLRTRAERPTMLLVEHALDLVFDSYMERGCFRRGWPLLTNNSHVAVFVTTAEACATLLAVATRSEVVGAGRGGAPSQAVDLLIARCEAFGSHSKWLQENYSASDGGWRAEGTGAHGVPNSFLASAAVYTLRLSAWLLDEATARHAARQLNVPTTAPKKVDGFTFPLTVGPVLEEHVIGPLTGELPRHLACYSMILYGPPGTAKSTIAKELAHRLGWPLLVAGPEIFLRGGPDQVFAEISSFFHSIVHLRNVVVLFDEVEELVEARGGDEGKPAAEHRADKQSRMLTTSMLPLLHELRDRRRVVFIFATNHFQNVDAAISRLGRFDIVRCVPLPSAVEQTAIVAKVLDDFRAPLAVRTEFTSRFVTSEMTCFGFVHIRECVRRVMLHLARDSTAAVAPLVEASVTSMKRNFGKLSEINDSFLAYSKQHDRP